MSKKPDFREFIRAEWEGSYISDAEADTIVLAQDSLRGSSEEWSRFYVEALTAHVLNAQGDRGSVDDRRAKRLISRIGMNGRLPGRDEFELVLNILERAEHASDILRRLALEEIVTAVHEGAGATRYRGVPGKGEIAPEEVVFIERILATTNPAHSPEFFREAIGMLYRIKGGLTDFTKPKEWARFFVEQVAQYLETLDRAAGASEAELRGLAQFMEAEGAGIAAFCARIDDGDFPEQLKQDSSLDVLDSALLETIYRRHEEQKHIGRSSRSIA